MNKKYTMGKETTYKKKVISFLVEVMNETDDGNDDSRYTQNMYTYKCIQLRRANGEYEYATEYSHKHTNAASN